MKLDRLTPEDWRVLQALSDGLSTGRKAISSPELIEASGLSPAELAEALLRLIVEGVIAPARKGGIQITIRL